MYAPAVPEAFRVRTKTLNFALVTVPARVHRLSVVALRMGAPLMTLYTALAVLTFVVVVAMARPPVVRAVSQRVWRLRRAWFIASGLCPAVGKTLRAMVVVVS
jgi:hypothetical protein